MLRAARAAATLACEMRPLTVAAYLEDGCGRCERWKTPSCKVHRFEKELVALRKLVLATGLTEEVKWGVPCYTLDGKNVVLVSAFNDFAALQLFRGAELDDPDGVLESPGPSSRFARYLKVRSTADVRARKDVARRLLDQAIALERSGKAAPVEAASEPMPKELADRLAEDPKLARAFAALTPGRRRSHLLFVGGAKQAATRERRAARCVPEILAGRGFLER